MREMHHKIKWFILSLLCLGHAGRCLSVRKFVYTKDMSEHCRRRVMPSVFLGRHVAVAHSQILHFSRLELPYSCFISVRGESGSNIILVVQLVSHESLPSSCSESPNQLLVYEMGETFGGFWGPVPEVMLQPPTVLTPAADVYTLATTAKSEPTTGTPLVLNEIINNTQSESTETAVLVEETQDYIRMEVPLVNVSGGLLVPYDDAPSKAFDVDDSFDVFYDVTPRRNESYETSVLPVVQFSMDNEEVASGDSGRRYQIQYDMFFTPDISKQVIGTVVMNFSDSYKYDTTLVPVNSSTLHNSNLKSKSAVSKWDLIEDIIRKLNTSNCDKKNDEPGPSQVKNLLEAMSNANYNYSVYLHPNVEYFSHDNEVTSISERNFSLFTRKMLQQITFTTRATFALHKLASYLNYTRNNNIITPLILVNASEEITRKSKENLSTTFAYYRNQTLVNTTELTRHLSHKDELPSTSEFQDSLNATSQVSLIENFAVTSRSPLTGSMVGRESWENVVQAAPVMVELLNQPVLTSDNETTINSNHSTTALRRKRYIQPIPIEIARPHNVTIDETTSTTRKHSFEVADVHDLMHFVELEDDELHDRVALRYLRQYVGTAIFNICEYDEPKTRHIFLFNSSRIAIALSNFTLDRMTVILTPARTLLRGSAKCSLSSLECQVYGTRVCIDKTNACDGVPNCGAYELYDEDRIMCGEAIQHNVLLAAIVFLAVLLTMLFIIHYWLKRCVPKVSEAFFVYTDGAENILYLESIMRSPFDPDSSRVIYHQKFETCAYVEDTRRFSQNICRRAWNALYKFIICRYKRTKDTSLEFDIVKDSNKVKRTYSFTELELSKISTKEAKDASVQTGDSLEMSNINTKVDFDSSQNYFPKYQKQLVENSYESFPEDTVQKYVNELNILKLCKDSKSDSLRSKSYESAHIHFESVKRCSIEEEELKFHSFEDNDTKERKQEDVSLKTSGISLNKPECSKQVNKRLRFEEEIASIANDDDDDSRQSTPLTKEKKWNKWHGIDDKRESDEMPTSISRDFKRFWTGKSKKSKKKTYLH